MRSGKTVKTAYVGLHVFYLAEVCMTAGFAVLFLSSRGLSNTVIGAVIALSRLLSIFAVKMLSQRLDADKSLLKNAFPAAAALLLLLHGALLFSGSSLLFTCLVFAVMSLLSGLCGSLLVILYSELDFGGIRINFGFSRGLGSLSYTVVSYIAGRLIARYSPELIPVIGLVSAFGLFGITLFIRRALLPGAADPEIPEKAGEKLIRYINSRPGFGILFIGILLIYTAYFSGNSFAVNMIRSIGGSGKELGVFNALGALIEVPFMILFSKVSIKNSRLLLRASLLLMTLKVLVLALSQNMGWVYCAAVLQGASYGLYTPAIVNYIKSRTSYANAAKGQSVASIASSLGGVCGMLITGRLLDLMPVKTVLLIMAAVSLAGALATWRATRMISPEE